MATTTPETRLIASAARGAELVKAITAQLNSPAHRCRRALLEAAVELHPNWSRTPGGYRMHRWSEGEPRDPGALLGWFTVADPEQGQAITERFFGSNVPAESLCEAAS